MPADIEQILAEYYQPGTEAYYATLYLPKTDKQAFSVLQLFDHKLWQILFSSTESAIRQQQINWWKNELQNTFLASNPCHPLSRELAQHFEKQYFLPSALEYLQQLEQISQQKHYHNPEIASLMQWKIAIMQNRSPHHFPQQQQKKLAECLYLYRHLKNLQREYLFGYRLHPDLPKYLGEEHFNGKYPQVIEHYIQQQKAAIESRLHTLDKQQLPACWQYPLVFMRASLKKVNKQPGKIYNKAQLLSPLKLLLLGYSCYLSNRFYYANKQNNPAR